MTLQANLNILVLSGLVSWPKLFLFLRRKRFSLSAFGLESIGPPPSFNERQFPFILEKARTVHPNDPVLEQWSYYPVCRVSFETKQGHYGLLLYLPVVSGRFMLKLGGLGILTLPDKSKGALMFPKEELCPTKDETD